MTHRLKRYRPFTSEKDLTVAARKSLNETLVLLDQRRYQEIDKLSDESINAAVNAELERVTKVLEASKDNAERPQKCLRSNGKTDFCRLRKAQRPKRLP